jgi:hypothetical protein
VEQKIGLMRNIFTVIFGKKSWVGYAKNYKNLPRIRKAVLSPIDNLKLKNLSETTVQRLNLLYAKDYTVYNDLDIIRNGFRFLGR